MGGDKIGALDNARQSRLLVSHQPLCKFACGGRSYSFASAQTYAYAYARAHGENKRGRVTAGHVARSVAFPEIAGGCLLGEKAHDSARELSGPDAQLRAL